MNDIGNASLLLLLLVGTFGATAGFAGAFLKGRQRLAESARRASYASFALALIASICLQYALLSRDFSNIYVYEHTSRDLPLAYTFSAFWSGNGGSLLLWLLLVTLCGAVLAWRSARAAARIGATPATRPSENEQRPFALAAAIMAFLSFVFCLILVIVRDANPFVTIAAGHAVPADGLGMNPQLVNLGMVIHPVAIYLGFVALAVPFALTMGWLLAEGGRRTVLEWTSRWTLFAWLFLTLGNVTGAWWAYVTLGWGGYWAWDPVENASLIPWLIATALAHSLLAGTRRRDGFIHWDVWLAVAGFVLTIFGTLITRSGLTGSVHAFGDTSLGPFFVALIAVTLIFAGIVVWRRRGLLAPASAASSAGSTRRVAFFTNNIVLAAMGALVLYGVLAPVLREAISGERMDLGPSFFNRAVGPLGLALTALLGVCTLSEWGYLSSRQLARRLIPPGAVAVVAALLAEALVEGPVWATVALALGAFSLAALAERIVLETRGVTRRTADTRPENTGEAAGEQLQPRGNMRARLRRYGAWTVHLGVILFLLGITGSQGFQMKSDQTVLTLGEALTLNGFSLTFEELNVAKTQTKEEAQAILALTHNGRPQVQVRPVREFYFKNGQSWPRVAVHSSLARDVYVILLDYREVEQEVLIQMEVNPLVIWLWIGGGLMAMGGAVALAARSRRPREVAVQTVRPTPRG